MHPKVWEIFFKIKIGNKKNSYNKNQIEFYMTDRTSNTHGRWQNRHMRLAEVVDGENFLDTVLR